MKEACHLWRHWWSVRGHLVLLHRLWTKCKLSLDFISQYLCSSNVPILFKTRNGFAIPIPHNSQFSWQFRVFGFLLAFQLSPRNQTGSKESTIWACLKMPQERTTVLSKNLNSKKNDQHMNLKVAWLRPILDGICWWKSSKVWTWNTTKKTNFMCCKEMCTSNGWQGLIQGL